MFVESADKGYIQAQPPMESATKIVNSGGKTMSVVAAHKNNLFDFIQAHRKPVLAIPFIFAAVLIVLYVFAGDEFRQVLDFMSPSHIFGH